MHCALCILHSAYQTFFETVILIGCQQTISDFLHPAPDSVANEQNMTLAQQQKEAPGRAERHLLVLLGQSHALLVCGRARSHITCAHLRNTHTEQRSMNPRISNANESSLERDGYRVLPTKKPVHSKTYLEQHFQSSPPSYIVLCFIVQIHRRRAAGHCDVHPASKSKMSRRMSLQISIPTRLRRDSRGTADSRDAQTAT